MDVSEFVAKVGHPADKLRKTESKLYPVMVWIHAGGYIEGSKSTKEHGPEHLLLEDVVLVCINYRLGILGFLSLQDTSLGIPGNAGLKDQILALKWVQRNIKFFNGDSDNVTIFGNSAGGSSVEFLMHSPLAKGLFHKAIIQSGSILNPWVFGDAEVMEFMQFIGKKCNTEKEALEILTKMPAKELCQYQIKYSELSGRPFKLGTFGPVVEKPNNNALITKTPIGLLTAKEYSKVPIMIGYAANEGILFKASEEFENSTKKPIPDETFFEMYVPCEFKDPLLRKAVCTKLRNFYFKEENELNKYEMIGDAYFNVGILASTKHYIKNNQNPVYLYRISLDAGLNGYKRSFCIDLPGTCHGDEVGYLFKQNLSNLKREELELASVRKIVKLWTNFAKYGNPTPNKHDLNVVWTPSDENLMFLDINQELVMKSKPKEEALVFWKSIYDSIELTNKFLD